MATLTRSERTRAVTFFKSRAVPVALIAFAAMVLGSCTVKETDAPPLAGPSETGLSLATSVTPDVLDQDGLSQAVVEVVTRGPDGRPVGSIPLRIEIRVGNASMDFGRLSNKTPVTGSDGVARVTYTAPPAPAEPVDTFTVVTLVITPVGGDFHGSNPRFVELRLVPQGRDPAAQRRAAAVVHRHAAAGVHRHVGDLRRVGDPRRGRPVRPALHLLVGLRRRQLRHRHGGDARVQQPGDLRGAADRDRRAAARASPPRSRSPSRRRRPRPPTSPTRRPRRRRARTSSSTRRPRWRRPATRWSPTIGTSAAAAPAPASPSPSATTRRRTYNVTLKVHDDTFSPGGTAVTTKAVTVATP